MKSLLLVIIPVFWLISCNDSPVPPEDNGDEGIVPQTNVEWPSLADTPWPMHHHDPQSTGRSDYSGPSQGVIYRKVPATMENGGIAIGFGQSVYIPQNHSNYTLFGADYEGNIKWNSQFVGAYSTPTIAKDSSIYIIGTYDFYAFNFDGSVKWKYKLPGDCYGLSVPIDKEGNIYFVSEPHTLIVLSKKGELLWSLSDKRLAYSAMAPVFSPDGKTLYLQGVDVSIVAVDIDTRSIKWTFGEGYSCTSPIIDSNGNLFFIPSAKCWEQVQANLYSIDQNGQINWSYVFKKYRTSPNVEPTIDYNGNIYIGVDTLYSFTNSGMLRWKVGFDKNTEIVSPLICDINNNIYVGLNSNNDGGILSYDSQGNLLWEVIEESFGELGTSPAISEDGTLFYPNWRGEYFIIIK